MKGWLIVNNFMRSRKFDELYELLSLAAGKEGIELKTVKTGKFPHSVNALKELVKDVDFALFWDKDVILAKQLEACGLRLFNSARAVEGCDNKALIAIALEKAGVPTPETYVAPLTFEGVAIDDFGFAQDAAEKLGYPFVVKEVSGSFGQQVYLADDFEGLKKIIKSIGHKGFLMQKFVKSSRGRDIRVNVVGGKVVCAMERHSENGDFRSNVTLGGSAKACSLSKEQKDIAVRACRALGLDFAGVDVLFGENGPLICEVNSNPHFKSTLDATGIDLAGVIMKYIKAKLQIKSRRRT